MSELAPNPGAMAEQMRAEYLRKQQEAVVANFVDVTNPQSLEDFNDFLNSRPDGHKAGNILPALEENKPDHYDATNTNPYESMSMAQLAQEIGEAERMDDKTKVNDLSDILMDRLVATSDGKSQQVMDHLYKRLMQIKDLSRDGVSIPEHITARRKALKEQYEASQKAKKTAKETLTPKASAADKERDEAVNDLFQPDNPPVEETPDEASRGAHSYPDGALKVSTEKGRHSYPNDEATEPTENPDQPKTLEDKLRAEFGDNLVDLEKSFVEVQGKFGSEDYEERNRAFIDAFNHWAHAQNDGQGLSDDERINAFSRLHKLTLPSEDRDEGEGRQGPAEADEDQPTEVLEPVGSPEGTQQERRGWLRNRFKVAKNGVSNGYAAVGVKYANGIQKITERHGRAKEFYGDAEKGERRKRITRLAAAAAAVGAGVALYFLDPNLGHQIGNIIHHKNHVTNTNTQIAKSLGGGHATASSFNEANVAAGKGHEVLTSRGDTIWTHAAHRLGIDPTHATPAQLHQINVESDRIVALKHLTDYQVHHMTIGESFKV